MSEAFLESYGGQSTEELLALAGKYRIDSLVLALEQAIQQKAAAPSKEESYPKTAAMTADAIAGRDDEKKLAACDERYYANDESIAGRLFEWIGNHRARIQLP
jgi:hypothetical protein